MDTGFNLTHLTLGGYPEMARYRYVYFVFMLAVYIVIICSNSTIICLIWIHQNLHEPMYFFIAALSLNSLLFSTAVYPKMLVDVLSERQTISFSACLLQYFLYYCLGSTDFLLLLAMAYDRYVSICKPMQYPVIMTKVTVGKLLGLSWIVPACLISVTTLLNANQKICYFTLRGIFCNNSIHKLPCVKSKVVAVYGSCVFVNNAVFPVAFIVFTYIKIFLITYRSCGKVRRKAAETCLPHLLVLVCFSSLCAFDVIIDRMTVNLPKTVRFIMTLQIVVHSPLFNPLIYGLKMQNISQHLRRLFCRGTAKPRGEGGAAVWTKILQLIVN